MEKEFSLQSIGVVESCYKEKFGIPRQPGLVTSARGVLRLFPPYCQPEVVRGLEGFSHIWLVFLFHQAMQTPWKPTVRPPRLGGNERLGVFATRSMFRPNPVGLSVVRLDEIRCQTNSIELWLSGLDLVDGTPVVDIKPYIAYADAITDGDSGFATAPPLEQYPVRFSAVARGQCDQKSAQWQIDILRLITQVLEQDPRPAYRSGRVDDRHYGLALYDFDVRWRIDEQGVEVLELVERAEVLAAGSSKNR